MNNISPLFPDVIICRDSVCEYHMLQSSHSSPNIISINIIERWQQLPWNMNKMHTKWSNPADQNITE